MFKSGFKPNNNEVKLGEIPDKDFYDYKLDVMFSGYKWDSQAGEQSTICNKVVLLSEECMEFLSKTAVCLYNETIQMETALKEKPDLILQTGASEIVTNALFSCSYERDKHIRLMRFDFHLTNEGWKISEVNSDVPAGYPDASVLPEIASKYFKEYIPGANFGSILADRLCHHAPVGSTIAYLYDTHTVEDLQILHYIGELMETKGYKSLYTCPTHIKWNERKAENIGAILRHYPIEWLEGMKNADLDGFVNSLTPSCNHPTALLAQSKRLPLVWDKLGVDIPYWKEYLPETLCPTKAVNKKGWILKPAFGRVGQGINIPGVVSKAENKNILTAVKTNPELWVAQKMFKSEPIDKMHMSLGVFVVDGVYAGLFARVSKLPRMDSESQEIPVLIKRGN